MYRRVDCQLVTDNVGHIMIGARGDVNAVNDVVGADDINGDND